MSVVSTATPQPTILTDRWIGTDGDFSDASNWSLHYAPTSSTAVVLSAGTETVTQSDANRIVNVASVSVGKGATLAINGSIMAGGADSVNYGTIALQGFGEIRALNHQLINKGLITTSSGSMTSVLNSGTVEFLAQPYANNILNIYSSLNLSSSGVLSGGTWIVHSSSADVHGKIVFMSQLGITTLSGKATLLIDGQDFHVQSFENGHFHELGSTLTTIDAGSTLSLNDNTFDIWPEDGSDRGLDISGTLKLSGGAVVEGKAITIEKGALLASSGSTESDVWNDVDIYGTVRAYDDSAIRLGGNGTLSGTLAGTGTVRIGGVLDVVSGAHITAAHLDVQYGTLDFQSPFTLTTDVTLDSGSVQVDGSALTLKGTTTLTWGGGFGGAGILNNTSTLVSGDGSISTSKFVNTGTVDVTSGWLYVSAAVGGAGTFTVHGGATLETAATVGSTSHVDLQGGTLYLDDAHHFNGLLTGLGMDDSLIDLTGFADNTERLTYKADADGIGGVLHIVSGTQSANLHFDENVDLAHLSHYDDGNGGSYLSYHDGPVSLTVHDTPLGF